MAAKRKNKKMLGNHQRSWVWGRNAVIEILRAGIWPVKELYLQDDLEPGLMAEAAKLAAAADLVFDQVPGSRLRELSKQNDHQGFLARMGPFPYGSLEEVFQTLPQNRPPLLLMLDGIQDAFNFGGIVRSAEVMGIQALIIGTRYQTGVTSMAARYSAGAVNRLPIIQTENLQEAITVLQDKNIQIAGASEKGAITIEKYDFAQPVCIVMGNEGSGLSAEVRAACDSLLQIPQPGTISSLNVAAAAAVICYEAMRQRMG